MAVFSELVRNMVLLVVGVLPHGLGGEVGVVGKLTASLGPPNGLTFVVSPEDSGVEGEVVEEGVKRHDIDGGSPVPRDFHLINNYNLNIKPNDKHGK